MTHDESDDGSILLAHWLARFALLAGDVDTAYDALLIAPLHESMRVIVALLDPTQAKWGNGGSGNQALIPGPIAQTFIGIWESYPCNYYTYRYSLIKDELLELISTALGSPSLMAPLRSSKNGLARYAADTPESLARHAPTLMPADAYPPDDPPPTYEGPPSPVAPPPAFSVSLAAQAVVDCLQNWNLSIRDFYHEKYTSSCTYLEKALWAALAYLAQRYDDAYTALEGELGAPETLLEAYDFLSALGLEIIESSDLVRAHIRERFRTLELDPLYEMDWVTPTLYDSEVSPIDYDIYRSDDGLLAVLTDAADMTSGHEDLRANAENVLQKKVDAPLLVLGLVLIPLALAEGSRKYRDYETAATLLRRIQEMNREAGNNTPLCGIIELPFVRIQLGQVLLERGEWQYKSGTPADPIEYNVDGTLKHQGLAAGDTFEEVLAVFDSPGNYASLVYNGAQQQLENLKTLMGQYRLSPIATRRTAPDPAQPLWTNQARQAFDMLSHQVPISTILTGPAAMVGPTPARPFEHIIDLDNHQGPILETNPLIYSLLTSATARLQQLDAGLNYLGYREDYIPPWRFQSLLVRARYFAEHAKSAQNEYINFLYNAEREEYQELSMQQQVILANANVQVETARVEQAQAQVIAAQESVELAQMTAAHAEAKAEDYETFNENASTAGDVQLVVSAAGAFVGAVTAAATAQPAAVAGMLTSATNQAIQNEIDEEQRALEEQSLQMAAAEADQAADVAQANYDVAVASLNVATLQKSVAILNQEFAVQNLLYLQNRTLNAEMWYRLASMIRGIGETYLHRAIELAFLAQRAYNFEEDRSIKVIRFDYDQDVTSGLLAADYLRSDLDTLEFDQTVRQRTRHQHVRYTASFAREYPSTLQEFRESGSVIFSLTLEQIERRFPGLYNVRLGSVDVTVTALMDSTRYSLSLTHLGTGRIRMTAAAAAEQISLAPVPGQPSSPPSESGTSSGQQNQSWIYPYNPEVDQGWPVIVHATGPETALYSGLTRPERDAAFTFEVTNQRGAFEGLCASSAWFLDMSMKENQIDPSTLVDVVVSFTISGYFDPLLRAGIEQASTQSSVVCRWLSAQRDFPDALYELQQTGQASLLISRDLLTIGRSLGALRNIGFLLRPSSSQTQLGSLTSSYAVDLEITPSLELQVLSEIPEIHFSYPSASLALEASATVSSGASRSWNFGDGTGWVTQLEHENNGGMHLYNRPGTYVVTLRVVKNNRLFDFTATVAISATAALREPLTAFPVLAAGTTSGDSLHVLVSTGSEPADEGTYQSVWQFGNSLPMSAPPTGFLLSPGRYRLMFVATRGLKARVYCTQRYTPDSDLTMEKLQLVTNREFNPEGSEVPLEYNALADQLFADGPIAPVDRWTLELPVSDVDNTFLRVVSQADEVSVGLGEIEDLLLRLEYETY